MTCKIKYDMRDLMRANLKKTQRWGLCLLRGRPGPRARTGETLGGGGGVGGARVKRLWGRRRWLVRPGPCAEWALRGLHPVFADLVRWGCFCITSFFILLSPPPPHSLSQSLFLSLSLSGHANCSQGQSVGCAPPKHPPPPPPSLRTSPSLWMACFDQA